MKEVEQILADIQTRARTPSTRTDTVSISPPGPLPKKASVSEVEAAEHRLGFSLHPFHRRLLLDIANGGFGPGYGLIGLSGGHSDADGRTMIELRDILWLDAETPLPAHVVPLCEWGGAIWSCVDGQTGHVLTLDEGGLTDTERSLPSWFEAWASGIDVFDTMFMREMHTGVNPFTKKPMSVPKLSRAIGVPYKPRS